VGERVDRQLPLGDRVAVEAGQDRQPAADGGRRQVLLFEGRGRRRRRGRGGPGAAAARGRRTRTTSRPGRAGRRRGCCPPGTTAGTPTRAGRPGSGEGRGRRRRWGRRARRSFTRPELLHNGGLWTAGPTAPRGVWIYSVRSEPGPTTAPTSAPRWVRIGARSAPRVRPGTGGHGGVENHLSRSASRPTMTQLSREAQNLTTGSCSRLGRSPAF
jgi:hypothetical protein